MQVAMPCRRAAAALLVLIVFAVGWSSVGAQDSEIHRFFGFLGDVTIDGQPVGPGSTIAALVNDEVVGETVVNAAGAWILDVNTAVFEGGDCNVTFVVNDLPADTAWDTCARRVRLALISPGGETDADSAQEAEDTEQADASATDSDAAPDASDSEEAMADELQEEDDNGGLVRSAELVRPGTPRTGTGGVVAESDAANWPRTAAITAALTLVAALAALMISRGTDAES